MLRNDAIENFYILVCYTRTDVIENSYILHYCRGFVVMGWIPSFIYNHIFFYISRFQFHKCH